MEKMTADASSSEDFQKGWFACVPTVTLEEPSVADVRRNCDGWEARLAFNPYAAYFHGHFPGLAVLPGVVQLGLAQRFAARELGQPPVIREVKRMKFAKPIMPRDSVRLELHKTAAGVVTFCYKDGDSTLSSGTLLY